MTKAKKLVTTILILAMAFTLAMPMQAEAASKPKLNKTKITLTITKKKTKPSYKLKVKNTAGKRVKWTTSNKKVAAVSKKGVVTAKKKGSAVVKAKVGKRTLTCKVMVKDNRKNGNTGNGGGNSGNTDNTGNTPTDTCKHVWVKDETNKVYVTTKFACTCGKLFDTDEEWTYHNFTKALEGDYNNHSSGEVDIYKVVSDYCIECGATRQHECQHNWTDVYACPDGVDTIVKKICTKCGLEKAVQ